MPCLILKTGLPDPRLRRLSLFQRSASTGFLPEEKTGQGRMGSTVPGSSVGLMGQDLTRTSSIAILTKSTNGLAFSWQN